MTGARSPAAAATLVNLAWKGSPEGLPRGAGATPRDAMPPYRCARAESASAGKLRIWRRESMYGLRISRAHRRPDTIGSVRCRFAFLIATLAALCPAADFTPA